MVQLERSLRITELQNRLEGSLKITKPLNPRMVGLDGTRKPNQHQPPLWAGCPPQAQVAQGPIQLSSLNALAGEELQLSKHRPFWRWDGPSLGWCLRRSPNLTPSGSAQIKSGHKHYFSASAGPTNPNFSGLKFLKIQQSKDSSTCQL